MTRSRIADFAERAGISLHGRPSVSMRQYPQAITKNDNPAAIASANVAIGTCISSAGFLGTQYVKC
jgi:hypothetical protein